MTKCLFRVSLKNDAPRTFVGSVCHGPGPTEVYTGFLSFHDDGRLVGLVAADAVVAVEIEPADQTAPDQR